MIRRSIVAFVAFALLLLAYSPACADVSTFKIYGSVTEQQQPYDGRLWAFVQYYVGPQPYVDLWVFHTDAPGSYNVDLMAPIAATSLVVTFCDPYGQAPSVPLPDAWAGTATEIDLLR